jgi:diguanylate cyclase (GGDEF)-like protein
LLDVDFFKAYNDHYGHQAGDDCLRQIAAVLKAELRRPADLVARYGGEEFVCLLPDTGHTDALGLAERMLRAVRAHAMPHAHSAAAPVVTVSLGVATRYGVDTRSHAADLLALADTQLYHAKRSGRARVSGGRLPDGVADSVLPEH